MRSIYVIQPSKLLRTVAIAVSTLVVSVGLVFTAGPAHAAERRITLPIAADHLSKVHWTDTWGAPRSGGRSHIGVDIMGPKMTPLVAVRDATITWGRFNNGRGSIVRMRDDEGWEYQYIHINNDTPGTDNGRASCEQAFSSRLCGTLQGGSFPKGVRVTEGEVIGYLGDSGNAESTPPHLHFEVYQPTGSGVTPINPTAMVDAARRAIVSGTTTPPPATPVPTPTKPVGHWSNASVAATDTFAVIHGRKPNSAELARFITEAESTGVWTAIANTYGDQLPSAEVARTYAALFGRQPDIAGYQHWVKARGNGMTNRQLVARFVSSREFAIRYRAATTEDYVNALYRNALGREPDAAGKAAWISRIDSGRLTRSDVAYEFVRSRESTITHRAATELTTMSVIRFGRIPPSADVAVWAATRTRRDLRYSTTAWYGN